MSNIVQTITNSRFEKPDIDNEYVSKLPRSDLESGFLELHSKCSLLKKVVQQQIKQLKRLNLHVQSLQNGTVFRTPSILHNFSPDSEYIKHLEFVNESLRKKVQILTIQLQNHSRLHAEVHACFKVPVSKKRREKLYHQPFKDELSKPSTAKSQVDQAIREKTEIREQDYLRGHHAEKESDHESGDVSSTAEGNAFEKPSDESPKNVEPKDVLMMDSQLSQSIQMIRMQRVLRRQSAQQAAMTAHILTADREVEELRQLITILNNQLSELSNQVSIEREKVLKSREELSEFTVLKQSHKLLLEKIKDCEGEREVLKRALEKLVFVNALSSPPESEIAPEVDVVPEVEVA